MEIEEIRPGDIEKRSFAIIAGELKKRQITLTPGAEPVVMRCIHTSADFDYAENLYFSDGVIERAISAIRSGADIVTDTQMAKAGISRRTLAGFGGTVHCFMSDEDVAEEAEKRGVTRAVVSMEKAARLEKPMIFAIGNAPTALIRVSEMYEQGIIRPEAVIGVPVGFVNVIAAKEKIMAADVPCIVARGRKGGSNIAACICNALLYMASGRKL